MNIDNIFWDASTDNLKKGCYFDEQGQKYICLVCGKAFTQGMIYESAKGLCDASVAAKNHISEAHGSMFEYLLNFNKKYSGVTDNQKELFTLFHEGLSDKEIVERTSAGSLSTIRNYRFSLREKYKQAKITVALTELMEEARLKAKIAAKSSQASDDELISIHRNVTTIDERFAITHAEKEDTLKHYFDENMNLKNKAFPRKEKRRIVIFQVIMENFERDRHYTEKEVNAIISGYYSDIETIRRFLIDYGFMDRSKDGRSYWVK